MRGRRTIPRWAAILAAGALLAAGCGDDGDDAQDASAPDATAAPGGDEGCTPDRVGGSVTMGEYSPTLGLDPISASGSGLSSGRVGATPGIAFYDVLVTFDEQTLEFHPQLAESITPNEDNTVWTLKLRPGITFDNGDPLDAEAVVTSIKRHVADDSRSTVRRGLALVEEYRIVDDLTIEFHLSAPWGYFPMVLSTSAGMITNQRIVEERGEDFAVNPAGAGVGPYELVSFRPGEELVLRAKDDYWGGPVCIQELRFVHLQGASLTYESLKAGQIDIGFLQEADVIAEAKADGYKGLQWVLQSGAMFLMNNGVEGTNPPTADLRVRQAIVKAIDVDVMDQRRFSGQGLPSSAITHADSPFAPDVEGPSYDPDEARRLVDEVKAETGWDGTIRLLCNEDAREAALAAESMLNAVGMRVQTTIGDTAGLIRGVITEKNYDLACWGINFTASDIWFSLSTYTSGSPTNYTGINDPQMDAALAELQAAANTEEIRDALGKVQLRWNEIVPSAPYAALETYVAYGDHVHGLKQTVRETFLFHDAYVTEG